LLRVGVLACWLVGLSATVATLIEFHRCEDSPNRPTQTRRFAFIDETFGPISDVIRDLPSIMVTYAHNISHVHRTQAFLVCWCSKCASALNVLVLFKCAGAVLLFCCSGAVLVLFWCCSGAVLVLF
jgi:hypothetical protein